MSDTETVEAADVAAEAGDNKATNEEYLATRVLSLQQENLTLRRTIVELKKALNDKDAVILELDAQLVGQDINNIVASYKLGDRNGLSLVKRGDEYYWTEPEQE